MERSMCRLAAILTLASALLVGGCAGTVKNMREVPPESAAPAPQPGKAMIVFLRPSGLGFAIQSSVFEVRGATPALVGIVAAKTKIAYHVDPGQRTFMALGESADFMTADLLPGRIYYAYVSPRIGMWKARFALEPKRRQDQDSSEFKTDLQDCRWVEVTPQTTRWMAENLRSIETKQAAYFVEWQGKPEADKPRLLAEDGR